MTAEIIGVEAEVLKLRVSGTLTQAELSAAQKQVGPILRKHNRLGILVVAENFAGWERGGAWGDFSFQEQHDARIARMAIVGDEQWRDLVLLFTSQGLRPFPVKFFPTERLAEARSWLASG